ncbi:MAG: hypothetical protein COA58_00995 [Bacteroidetes bacterium]|nr:MAG: hypothetical protein COA58_00995 [Bacteroidota bacterium]
MKKIFILLFAISVFVIACDDDDAVIVIKQSQEVCDSLDVLYSNDIQKILDDAGCSGSYCHGGGAAGYTMSDYATTKTSAEDSKFLKAIRHENGVSPMPKGGDKLSDDVIQKIECWIQNGYRE